MSMPRVNVVQSARKAQGKCGNCGTELGVGVPYKWIKFRYGPRLVRCANCRFRQSELTGSDKLSRLYAAQESIEELAYSSLDDIVSALNDAASEARDVGSEYQESHDNMPEGLQDGDVGQQCEENAQECESWADTLEEAASELENDGDIACEECSESEDDGPHHDFTKDTEDEDNEECSYDNCGKVEQDHHEYQPDLSEAYDQATTASGELSL